MNSNKTKFNKVIGILGGVGLRASIDIYRIMLDLIPVEKEWEYPHIIIDGNPQIPSRTRAYLFNETSPVPYLVESAKTLQKAGADFIIIPCNSASYYLPEIRNKVKIEILDIVELTSEKIIQEFPNLKKIVILGGEITIRAKLYEQKLNKSEIKIINITEEQEKILRLSIDMIKHNQIKQEIIQKFELLLKDCINQGAEAIVLACTELPLIFNYLKINVPIINPNLILAEAAINKAKNNN